MPIDLKETVRSIPDFPKKGILFKDITTLLKNRQALEKTIDDLAASVKNKTVDYVVAIESRGFIFGAALAYKLGVGFVPVRKKGKLPAETIRESYALEYGTDILEMHKDALEKGKKVLIVDDLLATGGTVEAVCRLIKKLGAEVAAIAFVIELCDLKGRDKLKGFSVSSLIQY